MKKILFLMSTLLMGVLSANATDEVVVDNVTIPQGGTATVNIGLNNDQEFTAFQMQLTLPEGVSFVVNKKGNPTFEKGDRYDDHSVSSSALGVFTCASFTLSAIDGSDGLLLSINVTADSDLEIGKTLQATLSNIEFTTTAAQRVQLPDVTINITIGEPDNTGVEALQGGKDAKSDDWYATDGRKLRGKPAMKGIYIRKGKKVAK